MKIKTYVKALTILVLCIVLISVVGFFATSKVKYPLNDCVTYFDSEARYQLIDVGNEYHILDASMGKSLCSNVKYYLHQDDTLYLIYDKSIGVENNHEIYERNYGILVTTSGEYTETNSLSSVGDEFKYDKTDMIDLTKRQNSFVGWLTDFLPRKFRKK